MMKELKKSKINALSFTWKIFCWILISLVIVYNFYLVTLGIKFYAFLQALIISIIISIVIYLFTYTIAEVIQLLEEIKNK